MFAPFAFILALDAVVVVIITQGLVISKLLTVLLNYCECLHKSFLFLPPRPSSTYQDARSGACKYSSSQVPPYVYRGHSCLLASGRWFLKQDATSKKSLGEWWSVLTVLGLFWLSY